MIIKQFINDCADSAIALLSNDDHTDTLEMAVVRQFDDLCVSTLRREWIDHIDGIEDKHLTHAREFLTGEVGYPADHDVFVWAVVHQTMELTERKLLKISGAYSPRLVA